ncbi:MAG: hypothetical protein KatS3mg105_4956 [Gemmatales bacterium]|nr:MAG: hypothetical protein KatS3mg105_4956 [Gemmatales bacterium]
MPDNQAKITNTRNGGNREATPTALDDANAANAAEKRTDKTKQPGPILNAAAIVGIALEEKLELFIDQYQDAFAWIPVYDPVPHDETIPLRSKSFRSHLVGLIKAKTSETPRLCDLHRATDMLELQALRSGRRELANRTTVHEGKVLIDVGDTAWKMIEVSPEGWSLKAHDQPRFFRVRHHKSLGPAGARRLTAGTLRFRAYRRRRRQVTSIAVDALGISPRSSQPHLGVDRPTGFSEDHAMQPRAKPDRSQRDGDAGRHGNEPTLPDFSKPRRSLLRKRQQLQS